MTMGYPLIWVENGIRMFTNGDSPICDRCEGPVEGEDAPMWCPSCDDGFKDCEPDGLAKELWTLCCDISDLNKALAGVRARKKHIEDTLLPLMMKNEIDHIDGEHPRLSVVEGWEYDLYRHEGKRVPVLEFAKEPRRDA